MCHIAFPHGGMRRGAPAFNTPSVTASLVGDDDTLRDQARGLVVEVSRLVGDASAASTLRSYRSDWADFLEWCNARDTQGTPAEPETVALYLALLAIACGRVVATIQRRLTCIAECRPFNTYVTPTRDERVRHHSIAVGGIFGVAALLGQLRTPTCGRRRSWTRRTRPQLFSYTSTCPKSNGRSLPIRNSLAVS